MEIQKLEKDLLDVESEAIIYSTNTRLSLTGGVGAALVNRFGYSIQTKLLNASYGMGMELASIGDVFQVKTQDMPWKEVFHTVCTDGTYVVDKRVVKKVIEKCLEKCMALGIKNVATSKLGTGYGSLKEEEFMEVIENIASNCLYDSISSITVCSLNEKVYEI